MYLTLNQLQKDLPLQFVTSVIGLQLLKPPASSMDHLLNSGLIFLRALFEHNVECRKQLNKFFFLILFYIKITIYCLIRKFQTMNFYIKLF
jgi:hypothetical protein